MASLTITSNKLNFVRDVVGTKYPPALIGVAQVNKCQSIITRGNYRCIIFVGRHPQHLYVCANVVTLSLQDVPATHPYYMAPAPQCVLHDFYFAAATYRCTISLKHDPSCLVTFRALSFLVVLILGTMF